MAVPPADFIGLACAYTPLPVIVAGGCTPYRVLPMTESADQAGRMLHDNICPHVKRILDRAMDRDLPELRGMVFVNSCDAMRRLFDAWRRVEGAAPAVLIDLPPTADDAAIAFFADEIERLARILESWCGRKIDPMKIGIAVEQHNALGDKLETLMRRVERGTLEGGWSRLQAAFNIAVTTPHDAALGHVDALLGEPPGNHSRASDPPIFLFGNVLPDPDAHALFEACGARVVGEDLCTGSRTFTRINTDPTEDPFRLLAGSLLRRPRCARTFEPSDPGRMSQDIVHAVKRSGAKGAICHTVKFCDPYLVRLPLVREALQREGYPLLVLEGDCTLRSMGQHRTRIEAFAEMLR